MARVFVSWGSPDQEVVTTLVRILHAAGVDLFEYTDAMRAGDRIHDRVLSEIRNAEIALLCLSDQSIDREWVQRECYWCFSHLMDPDRPLKRLVAVEVGALTESKVPPLLKEAWLHRFNVLDHGDIDRGLGRLLNDVQDALGGPPPLFVPATIFAMTQEQIGALLLGTLEWAPLRLGQRLGVEWQEDPRPDLTQRYGAHCLDFRPFLSNRPLRDIVQETINRMNEHGSQNRPIQLIWYDPGDLLKHLVRDPQGLYWEHFNTARHMIIIDSISMLHEEVRTTFVNIIGSLSGGVDWRALTWIPPYTQQIGGVEELIFEVAETVAPIVNEFHRWRGEPGSFCSFDAYTKSGFQHWLWNALTYLTSGPYPTQGSLEQIRANHAGPARLPSRARP